MSFFRRWFGAQGSTPLPELTSDSEEGWHDCVFGIESEFRSAGAGYTVQAAALSEGTRVAFEVVLGAGWERVTISQDPPISAWRGLVSIRRVGADSDALVRVLDTLYGLASGATSMAPEVTFTALSLEGDPRALARGPVKLKLFHEPAGLAEDEYDAQYAEVYLNVELSTGRLWLAEKDEEYRAPLLRALAHAPGGQHASSDRAT